MSDEIAVDLLVVGLGYVGLPLAREAVRAGLRVCGYDTNPRVALRLNAGASHVDGVSDDDVVEMLAAGFDASGDGEVVRAADVIVLCVPTPLTADGAPDLTSVVTAARLAARRLRPGTLVVLESTTYPGTTDDVVRPILEESGLVAGEDFALAFAPERIDPGNAEYGISNTPRIVGGHTPGCTRRALDFYSSFVKEVVPAKGTREAEMAKILENTYRQVNIALVNELAMVSHSLGIDVWDVIACARTKPFGFASFTPGPGVGGHCIPVDPLYLSYKARELGVTTRMIDLAQQINDGMPEYVVQRAAALLARPNGDLARADVLLLGVTYKADVADRRESPADDVVRQLRSRGAVVRYHDPFVDSWSVDGRAVDRVDGLDAALRAADVTILLQWHAQYRAQFDANTPRLLFDTRGRLGGRPGVAVL
ncbi:nucleotide sugar dehydrogenase [Kitasatospora sp. MAP5-34]|uniref:nucleotide sugar dehydrogenase n=1 Tax=Kitasatospora sp. MAP5-34 TaxID=3035102 RepID=UPI0024761303|nr:nucleotide sugar dehydrogenase [Kitasatospora sp. MAP5-34]MDH6578653.1 UDP-N-acetyl-D-glucosamine dehydrogenase [Kitasatospora sp. MAP5-34]